MKAIKNDFIIISAETENSDRTEELKFILDNFPLDYVQCKGMYKATEETSFLIRIDSEMWLKVLTNLALFDFEQESVLIRMNDSIYLDYGTDKKEYFSKFEQVADVFGVTTYTNINGKNWVLKR